MVRIDRIDDYGSLRESIMTSTMTPDAKGHALRALDSEAELIVLGASMKGKLTALCIARFLEWDSEFFGKRSYQIEIVEIEASEEPQDYLAMLVESTANILVENGAEFASARVDVSEGSQIRALEMVDFRTYDLSCVFGARKGALLMTRKDRHSNVHIRESHDEDVWRLIELSASAFTFDRFHEDHMFGKERADAMHGIWIRNLHYSESSIVLIAELEEEIVGYVTYQQSEFSFDSQPPESVLRIGLIAVDQESSGRGIGSALVDAVLRRCHTQGLGLVVGTQLSNTPAIRLYQGRGLDVVQTSVTLHRWFETKSDQTLV